MDVESAVEFVGPFEHHEVVVSGWRVPFLRAEPQVGGRILLTLDDRFALDVSLQEAERVAPFLAQAIAVALGYASHPEGEDAPKQLPYVRPRRMIGLDVQAGPAS